MLEAPKVSQLSVAAAGLLGRGQPTADARAQTTRWDVDHECTHTHTAWLNGCAAEPHRKEACEVPGAARPRCAQRRHASARPGQLQEDVSLRSTRAAAAAGKMKTFTAKTVVFFLLRWSWEGDQTRRSFGESRKIKRINWNLI